MMNFWCPANHFVFSMKLLIALLLLPLSLPAAAGMSIKEKNYFYEVCQPKCVAGQKRMPANVGLLPTPFVLESFCSCACTRMAMRTTTATVLKGGHVALEGKTIEAVPELASLQKNAVLACTEALYGND